MNKKLSSQTKQILAGAGAIFFSLYMLEGKHYLVSAITGGVGLFLLFPWIHNFLINYKSYFHKKPKKRKEDIYIDVTKDIWNNNKP